MVAWALVLVPVYVYRRQRALGRGLAPFWVYVTILVGGIVASVLGAVILAVAPPPTIDADLLESQIEQAVWDEVAIATTIECPDHQPADPGHRFTCTLADGVGVATIRAVVTSTAGDVTWTIE